MLGLTDYRPYRLEIDFAYDEFSEVDTFKFGCYKSIQKLLYSSGIDDISDELSKHFTEFLKLQYPGTGINGAFFHDMFQCWPGITVEFSDIVYAYKFAFLFDGGIMPKDYNVNELCMSATFWSSLVPEFNRSRFAADKLGLTAE